MLRNAAINILMVEDNTGDQFLLSEILKSSDIAVKSVYTARSLQEAMHQLKQPIDIILLDLSLPDSSGIDTFNAIIQVSGNAPVVILSGLTDMRLALDAITLGAQDYLIKGDFDEKLLAKTIRYSIERKKNLEALQESIERYNLVTKATQDMVWDWNLVTGEIYRNVDSWNKIFGTSFREIDSHEDFFNKRIHPDDAARIKKTIDEILANPHQYIYEIESRVRREDGTYAYVCDLGYIIRDDTGKANRVIGALQNITERKEAEKILKASEERYRYLFNNNPACIIIWDLNDFKILEVNDSSIKQYNYTREEFIQKTVMDLSSAEDRNEVVQLAEMAKKNKSFKITAHRKHLNKSGDVLFMEITSHRINYNGKPVILVLANNVTEKILLEQKLISEQTQKQQEITEAVIIAQEKERNEIGGELHDNVNQILASARLYLGLAKREINRLIPFIEETDKLIYAAISEIRLLSHSLIAPSLENTQLGDALQNIMNTVSAGGIIKVHADLKRFNENTSSGKLKLCIYRIVQEQFNNILKHAHASIVYITLAHEGDKLVLLIKDNGRGFDKLKKTAGVGLLNISTRASLFNGEMEVISSPGNGCELLITFMIKSQGAT